MGPAGRGVDDVTDEYAGSDLRFRHAEVVGYNCVAHGFRPSFPLAVEVNVRLGAGSKGVNRGASRFRQLPQDCDH